MNVRILSTGPGALVENHHLTSFLVNDTVAVDAGSLALHGSAGDQARVHSIFITHTHLDHLATLPLFLETVHGHRSDRPGGEPARVALYGSAGVLECLRSDIFNGRVWPDYFRLAPGQRPELSLSPLEPEGVVEVGGLRVTAVPVDHVVPTYGYVVDDGEGTVVFGGDSGPTERIWEVAARSSRWKAAFVECTFPDRLSDLARITGHLTPGLFAAETHKFPSSVTAIAVHIRPRHREEIVAELDALDIERLIFGEPGVEYRF